MIAVARTLGVGIAAFALSGCLTGAQKIQVAMNPWIGQPVSALLSRWGPPSSTFAVPGGGTIYTWVYVGPSVTAVNSVPWLNLTTATTTQSACRFDWTISDRSTVESYRWSGNCRAR